MKTYSLEDENGFQFGFEIDNIYIGLGKIIRLLSTLGGISKIKRRRLFDCKNEYHIEFDYLGEKIVVLEPYGDNSRYLIYPKETPDCKIDISEIENAFKQYKPPILIKIIGDLISLNFKNILKRNA